MQPFIHYFLHLIFPAFIAFVYSRSNWKKIYLIFLLTMLVDLDHLAAVPVFDPCRCSINFHFLHKYYMMAVYVVFLFNRTSRPVALGLLMHMITDQIDCLMIGVNCK